MFKSILIKYITLIFIIIVVLSCNNKPKITKHSTVKDTILSLYVGWYYQVAGSDSIIKFDSIK